MEEKLVTILNEMAEYLSIAQMKKLQEVLLKNLAENEPQKAEISNAEYLQMFLDAKKIEGCSERTLQYYRVTVERMLQSTTTPIRKICTEEIRSYLSGYQQINGCGKVTVDNIRRNISSFFSWLEEEDYMPAVSESGKIDASQIKAYDEVKTGFTYFAENDVLFAKITPCMENGKGAVAVGLCNNIGFGSTEFHILRPINNKSNPYWLYSLTSFDAFRKDAADNMTGSAGQRRVPAVFLEKYKVTLPPIELQNQFAAFVEQTDKSKAVEGLYSSLCL